MHFIESLTKRFLLVLVGLLYFFSSAWSFNPPFEKEEWYRVLIREGRKRLLELKEQNTQNQKKGLGYQNEYILYLNLPELLAQEKDTSYPNARYIRQRLGNEVGEGTPNYMLDPDELIRYNRELSKINGKNRIQNYLMLINGVPLPELKEVEDYQSIQDVFNRQREASESSSEEQAKAQAHKRAGQIIEEMTKGLEQENPEELAFYCGYVSFIGYAQSQGFYQMEIYYPRPQGINFPIEYKRQLGIQVTNATWEGIGVKNVATLVECVAKTTDNYESQEIQLEILNSTTDPERVIAILASLSDVDLASLSLDMRLHALDVLAAFPQKDRSERGILKLLSSTPSRDISGLMAGLQSANKLNNDQTLILDILEDMWDNVLWGTDGYTGLMAVLRELNERSPEFAGQVQELYQNPDLMVERFIIWDRDYTFSFVPAPENTKSYTVNLGDQGETKYQRYYLARERRIVGTGGNPMVEYRSNWVAEGEKITLNPFEPVILFNQAGASSVSGQKGEMRVVPAITLKYLKDKEWNARYWDGAFISLDALTLITGAGALSQASKLYRIWLLFEMSNATGNLLITGQVIEDENFKALVGLQDVLVAGIGLKNLMQQANKIDFAGAVSKLKNQSLALGESFWKQAREHLTIWENLKASPDIFRQIPEKVKTQIENLSEILKKEHRRLRNYELKPIKGALFSGIGLELKKILSDEAYKKLQSLKLGDELEKALYQDLKGNQSLRKAFNEKPNSLEAWYVLSSDKSLRKSVADISKMQKYLDEPYAPLNEIDLNKVKRAFEEAQKQGGREGVKRFISNQIILIRSGQDINVMGKVRGVINFSEPDFSSLATKIKEFGLEDLGLGYAGVISPDGRVAFHLTADVSNFMKGTKTPDKLKFLSKNLGERVYSRNGSHASLERIGFPDNTNSDLLWGFAINQKPGQDIIEIGFVSGEVNATRSIGRGGNRRLDAILNRTDQKKVFNFLEKYLDGKFKIVPKPPRTSQNGGLAEYY